MRRVAAVGLLSAGLVLAGCSGGDDGGGTAQGTTTAPAPTSTAVTTSAPPPTTTAPPTGPGGVPVPAPGPLAARHDETGAKAFAVYFVKVVDYVFATQDVSPISNVSTKECSLC